MKDCFWCKKSCSDDEEGSFELDPEDETIELGWICDHCCLAYIGECDCEECTKSDKKTKKAIKERSELLS